MRAIKTLQILSLIVLSSVFFSSCKKENSTQKEVKQPTQTVSEADVLAKKVLKAIKHDAYKNTRYISWAFLGKRYYNFSGDVFYKWDKKEHIIELNWKDTKVMLHPNNLDKSQVFVNDSLVKNDTKTVTIANDLFNNDSFWLVAPHKLFDKGTIRSIVNIDGKKALKVKYTTGGTTPGDSYTWILNDDNLPVKYLMDIPSMNLNKVSATWQEWKKTSSGTLLPKLHVFADNSELSMGEVKGHN